MLKTCLWSGICPLKWKNVNFVPIHKKGNSLLPICEKVFASMFCKTMFNFFSKSNVLSSSQTGFRPGDSCIN